MRRVPVLLVVLLLLPIAVNGYPFMVGARLSTPQIASISLSYRPADLWFIQLEPGIGGGKAALGIGGSWEYMFGIALKSSLLYTWGNPIGDSEAEQTYAGGEGVIMVSGINLTFGLYGHVNGNDKDKDMLVSVGAGLGF
ncbi:MAG: hypothetical protein GY852_05590 [bacterium]|nr:hypothetical protein [bacterium]